MRRKHSFFRHRTYSCIRKINQFQRYSPIYTDFNTTFVCRRNKHNK